LLTFSKGAGYKGTDLEDLAAPHRLLSITAIRPRGGFNAEGLRPFSGRFGEQHVCRPGEIVVALTDLTQDGSMLGSPAQVPDLDATLVASHHVGRISGLSPDLCGVWLYYRLQAPDWALRAAAWSTGTTVRQFRPEALESWIIDIPPLPEQQRIGRVLAAIDRKATSNAQLRASLHAHAEALYQHAAAVAEDRVPLSEIATRHATSLRPAQRPDDLFEHFSIPAFDSGTLSSIDEGRTLLSGKFTLPDAAVALSKLNPETKRVLRTVRRTNHPAICSSEFVVLLAEEGISPALLHAMLAFDREFYDDVLAGVSGTTTSRQRVTPGDVLSATVPVFDPPTLQRLNERLNVLEQLSAHLHVQRARLHELRDHVLPRLVRGKDLLTRAAALVS
jgi:type I restriction enzyme S subunit